VWFKTYSLIAHIVGLQLVSVDVAGIPIAGTVFVVPGGHSTHE